MTTETKRPIPRKLNDGMIEAISTAIRKGNYMITACQLAGIDASTMFHWHKQGQDDIDNGLDTIYTRLIISVKRAEAEAEQRLVEVVREAAEVKRDWLPAMTFLERRHPDRWGRKDRTQIDVTEHKQIVITEVEVIKDYGPKLIGSST